MASTEDQPHGAVTHFRGKFVRRLAHNAPSYSGVGASGKPSTVHDDSLGLMQVVSGQVGRERALRGPSNVIQTALSDGCIAAGL
jgi:hypothetical protein